MTNAPQAAAFLCLLGSSLTKQDFARRAFVGRQVVPELRPFARESPVCGFKQVLICMRAPSTVRDTQNAFGKHLEAQPKPAHHSPKQCGQSTLQGNVSIAYAIPSEATEQTNMAHRRKLRNSVIAVRMQRAQKQTALDDVKACEVEAVKSASHCRKGQEISNNPHLKKRRP